MSSYRSGSIVPLRVMLLGNYIIIILAKLHILGLQLDVRCPSTNLALDERDRPRRRERVPFGQQGWRVLVVVADDHDTAQLPHGMGV